MAHAAVSFLQWRQWLRRDLPLLALILLVGAALRVARIDFDSLTFDEQWHLELSTGRGSPHIRIPKDTLIPDAPAVTSLAGAPPWYAVWSHMDRVVHPPLYCTLLRLWRDLFGGGDAAARAFSIVCSLLAIALLYETARRLHGRTVGFWAAALMAVAPMQVFLSEQVRGYNLLQAIFMAALLALVRLEQAFNESVTLSSAPSPSPGTPGEGRGEGGPKDEGGRMKDEEAARCVLPAACCPYSFILHPSSLLLGFAVLGMMLTHYFAVGGCAAIGLYVLIRLRGRARRDAVLALLAAAVVFLIIWGPLFWRQRRDFAETADPWLVEHLSNHALIVLGRAVTAPWRLFVDAGGQSPWAMLSALLLVLPPLLVRRRPQLLLWCLWLAGTIGMLLALDLTRSTRHLEFPRYLSPASPAVFALVAALPATLLSRFGPRLWQALPAAIAIAGVALSGRAYISEEPDWRSLQVLDKLVAPGEALLFYPGDRPEWYAEILYLGTAHYTHLFPRPMVRLSRPASPELIARLPGKSAWLISGPLPNPPQEVLPGCRPSQQFFAPKLALLTHVSLPEK